MQHLGEWFSGYQPTMSQQHYNKIPLFTIILPSLLPFSYRLNVAVELPLFAHISLRLLIALSTSLT